MPNFGAVDGDVLAVSDEPKPHQQTCRVWQESMQLANLLALKNRRRIWTQSLYENEGSPTKKLLNG